MTAKISIIGAGAWGTTLANLLSEHNHQITLWAVNEELKNEIINYRENRSFLPGVILSSSITVTSDFREAGKDQDLIILVTPSQFLRETLIKIKPFIGPKTLILSATKGLEKGSLKRMSEVILEELKIEEKRVAVLSGPNLAKEISSNLPAAAVVAGKDSQALKKIQNLISTPLFRIYRNGDPIGVEMGGTLKNIIAIACGILDALKLGNNAKSALMTRAISEITRLGVTMGAKPSTFFGLSGLGDLFTTCASPLSRNYSVGFEIGKGNSLEMIMKDFKKVAEGVNTTRETFRLTKKLKVEMPIVNEVYAILFEDKSPQKALTNLMNRELKEE